jgi:hypothetical protein
VRYGAAFKAAISVGATLGGADGVSDVAGEQFSPAGLVISQGMRWRNTQSRLDAENRRLAALSAKGDPLRADTPSLDS